MDKTKVLVNFIQDRSGSMGNVWGETLSGFKVFVENLKKESAIEYLFSLTVFDTLVEQPVKAKAIGEVDTAELAKHGPRGGTALYDAVGAMIEQTDKDRQGAEKIICVIVTDGEENSSREWTKERLNQAIDEKLKAGDWTFTYLGTQPETWNDAEAIGVSRGATAGYMGMNTHDTYHAVSGSINNLARSSERSSKNLFTSQHADNKAMVSAGMTVKPDDAPVAGPAVLTTTKAQTQPRKPARSTVRWR